MNELDLHIDHITLSVVDMAKARPFYEKALAPLGFSVVAEFMDDEANKPVCAFGVGRKGTFWLAEDGQQSPAAHFAFRANSRQAVKDFHEAAFAAGGTCNGLPGPREEYHPEYYAAFVLDPEGHNVEAVTFEPEESR